MSYPKDRTGGRYLMLDTVVRTSENLGTFTLKDGYAFWSNILYQAIHIQETGRVESLIYIADARSHRQVEREPRLRHPCPMPRLRAVNDPQDTAINSSVNQLPAPQPTTHP